MVTWTLIQCSTFGHSNVLNMYTDTAMNKKTVTPIIINVIVSSAGMRTSERTFSVYATYEVNWVLSIPDDGWAPLISTILGPPEGRKKQRGQKSNHFLKLTLTSVYTRYEVDWVITIPGNGRKPSISTILWLMPMGQKIESILNTHLTGVYTSHEVDWVTSIPDNGQKPTT